MITNIGPVHQVDLNYICHVLNDFEKTNSRKIIFGSIIGSASQGLTRSDSDLDCRFLYIDKSGDFVGSEFMHDESHIRYRVVDKTQKCNCIPFWEISAFLNFLYEPYLDSGEKYKLVRNVIWSFCSPYSYDPYGLQIKLMPLIELAVDLKKEFDYHYSQAMVYYEEAFSERKFKVWIHAIYHLLSCRWIWSYRNLPPVSIYTLLSIISGENSDFINDLLTKSRVNSDFFLSIDENCVFVDLADQIIRLLEKVSSDCFEIKIDQNKDNYQAMVRIVKQSVTVGVDDLQSGFI